MAYNTVLYMLDPLPFIILGQNLKSGHGLTE